MKKQPLFKIIAIALAFSLMLGGIIAGTEKHVYASAKEGYELSMGTNGETAGFDALCTSNGFSLLPDGKLTVSVYDLYVGDTVYYYNKKAGVNQKFRVTGVTGDTVELMFADHFEDMESITVTNSNRNGFAQSGFIKRYSDWATTGKGKKYFYECMTDEQKGALVKKKFTFDFIASGESIFGQNGGIVKTTGFDSYEGYFGPISLKDTERSFKTYDKAKAVLNIGQSYFTLSMAGYIEYMYSGASYDRGEFMWAVGQDGTICTKQWNGTVTRDYYSNTTSFTAYLVPSFTLDKEIWEQCADGYIYESNILKAQSMTYSGIGVSEELSTYNNNATERNINLLASNDILICPYDGASLGDIPVNRTISLPYYNASGIKYNENSSRKIYISAVMIADNRVKYYGRLTEMQAKEGEVSLKIPDGLTLGRKHYILLFEENASNLDNNTMTRPQIMSFTPVADGHDTVDSQELNGIFNGVGFKGTYSIKYDSTAGKDINLAENLCVTDSAEKLVEGGALKIPETIVIEGVEYIVDSIGGGTYDEPFVPRETEFKSVYVPKSVTEIKPYAFYNTKAEELTVDSSSLTIGTGAFSKCRNLRVAGVRIGRGAVGNRAFYDCNSLETVNLEGGISVGEESFAECESLSGVIIKALTGSVKKGAFKGSCITELYLPNSVNALPFAFEGCKKLKVVETDMTTLDNNVFYDCSNISKVVFDEHVENVRENWGGYEAIGTTGRKKGERRFIYVTSPYTKFYFSKPGMGEDKAVFSSLGARSASDLYHDYYRDVTVFYNKTSYPIELGYSEEWSMENDRIYSEEGALYKVYMNPTAMAENYADDCMPYCNAEMERPGTTEEKELLYALNVTFERADDSTDAWAKALYEGKASYVPKSYQTGIKASFSGVVREGSEIKKSRFSVSPVYSDAVITNETYGEDEFCLMKLSDFEALTEEEKTKENLDAASYKVTAKKLDEGEDKGYEDLVLAVFSNDKLFTATLRVTIAAEAAELKPSEEYGSQTLLEDAIVSLKQENAGLSELLKTVRAEKEDVTAAYEASEGRVRELEAELTEKDERIAELERIISEHVCDKSGSDTDIPQDNTPSGGNNTPPPENTPDGGDSALPTETGSRGNGSKTSSGAGVTGNDNMDPSGGAGNAQNTGGASGSKGSMSPTLSEYISLYTQVYDYRQKVSEMESKNAGLGMEVSDLNGRITNLNSEILSLKEELVSEKNKHSYDDDDFDKSNYNDFYPEGSYNEAVLDHSPNSYYDEPEGYSYEIAAERSEGEAVSEAAAPVHVHIADTTISNRARIVPMGENALMERIDSDEEEITVLIPEDDSESEEKAQSPSEERIQMEKRVHVDTKVLFKGISIVALILAIYAVLIKRNRKKHYETLKSFLD